MLAAVPTLLSSFQQPPTLAMLGGCRGSMGLVRRTPPLLSALDGQSSSLDRSSMWLGKDSSSSPNEVPSPRPQNNGAANGVVLLLMLATFNQWARALIFYVVDFKTAATDESARLFMNVDIGFDAAQYGILASIGFAALFSLTSLVAGGLVDRYDTRNLCAEFACGC